MNQTRRDVVAGFGVLSLAPLFSSSTLAQQAALPLDNLGLEHLDILVPDTAAAASFYLQVFDTALHQQPFRGSIRYFVLLGDLPADRQVGYIAIGAAGDRPVQIGHYCALARQYDREGVASALETAGYPVPAGGFGMIPDVDGIELQLFTLPAGLVTAAVPADLSVEANGIFRPLGVDHVLLQVSDTSRSLDYYRFLYGPGLETEDPTNSNRIWIELEADSRIGLEPVPAGATPGIVRFGIKVEPFDRVAALEALDAMGVEVSSLPQDESAIEFRDNYGITLQVIAG